MQQIITNSHTTVYADPDGKDGEYYIDAQTKEVPKKIGEFGGIRFQNRPVQESRVNGCQVEDVLEIAKHRLNKLNKIRNCREIALAITKLEESLHWLNHRTNDRINRGVEGTSKP